MTRIGGGVQMPLAGVGAAVTFGECDQADSNRLLIDWQHSLGPCLRPYGIEPWLLEVAGAPVAVAVGATTVSATCGDWKRTEVVELARLCTDPANRWATRVALRLWREVAAQRWPHWPVRAAMSYSQNDRHDGRIYRFDGWTRVRDNVGTTTGGGQWTKTRGEDHPAAGSKSLWEWRYE